MAVRSVVENKLFWLLFLADGFIWLRSGLGKISSGDFIETLPGTLAKLASSNPYSFFKDFLQGVAIPNASFFGVLTLTGEVFAGAAIVSGSIYLLAGLRAKSKVILILLKLGLLVGVFLSVIFYLAAAWTSPSTESLNLLMAVLEAVGVVVVWQKVKAS